VGNHASVRNREPRPETKEIGSRDRPCMCFVGMEVVYRSESKTQVVNFLVNMIKAMGTKLEVLCYDDMCHLDAFIHKRKDRNIYMQFLDGLRKYIDRFHLRNHRNEECKKKYDPDNDASLKGVNTERQIRG
jgi:hypothetical protein